MSCSLDQLGENELLRRLLRLLPPMPQGSRGAGDDCAVVPRDARWDTLLKTDAIVEGVHFLPGTDPTRIGHKALARVLSDIAAMGGLPEFALVTLFVHPSRTLELLEGIYAGLSATARQYGVAVAGGETTSLPHDGLAISIAMTGRVEHGKAILRSTGRAGDILCVSGPLGGSFPSGRHLDFEPRLELARQLMQEHLRPSAMMDLSDGLGTDLPRLAEACGCSFAIDPGTLPRHEGCSVEQAICDGEDYELLLSISPEHFAAATAEGLSLYPIGHLTADRGTALPEGWQHFHAEC